MRTHARVSFFGFGWYCSSFRGSNCPKNNFWGVNRDFPAKRAKHWNVHIIKTTASIITKFCRVIETLKYSLRVVQICPQTNPRWRTATILKNWKILISSQPIDRFWQSLASWCVSTFCTPIANTILRFQKSKMAAAAIIKIRIIAISPQGSTNFDNIWHSDATEPSRDCQQIKIHDFENPRWRRPPSWEIEKS